LRGGNDILRIRKLEIHGKLIVEKNNQECRKAA
jgi:hypothetical protein